MTVDITADEFNAKYPVGTPVKFWPGWRTVNGSPGGAEIPPVISKTTTPAWEMPNGEHVVTCEGRSGGMWLQHVEIIEDDPFVEKLQAQFTLATIGRSIESSMGEILRLLEPYYKPSTNCDGKCAKVEDLEEELESAKSATKVAVKLSEELAEKLSAQQVETNRRGLEADRLQERAETAEAETERVGREFRRLTEESAARMQEIERLRSVVRFDQQQHNRDAGTFAVYQGVIAKKEEELAEAAAKISSLQDMLNTQHGRLTVLEGDLGSKTRDYNNIEAKFVEARQKEDRLAEEANKLQHERSCALTVINPKLDPFSSKRSLINETTELANRAEMLAADLADCQEEREQMYMLLDPETDLEDRRFGPVDLLRNLIAENQRLETEAREKPHAGCRQLEAGLNERLQVAQDSSETYQAESIRLARGWDGARTEAQGLRMQIQSYEQAPEKEE
jgi:DNA repair exonuclease SbcCD ATPase subunit